MWRQAQRFAALGQQLRQFAPRTLVRSCYLSRKHTARWSSLIIGHRALCEFAADADIHVAPDARLLFATGDREFGATHPELSRALLRLDSGGKLRLPSGHARVGPGSIVHVEGTFEMGSSYINSHARILCGDSIRIGDGCALAWNVELLDDDRHQLQVDGTQVTKSDPIVIEDDVWIGNNVLVKKGVHIGEGAVIGSGSVVTDDIPAGTLAVGNPAEVIYDDVSWQ